MITRNSNFSGQSDDKLYSLFRRVEEDIIDIEHAMNTQKLHIECIAWKRKHCKNCKMAKYINCYEIYKLSS